MGVIIAEFHYWDYGEFAKTAMVSRPEIKNDELERIARRFNVKAEAKNVVASYLNYSPGIRMRLPSYRRVDILVSGGRTDDIKGCISEIFKLYGKPDEVPRAMFGSKKAGKKIINEVLRHFDQTRSSGFI